MTNIKQFMNISGQMKNLKRQGWIYRNVDTPESDAAHSWSLSLLIQLYAPKELDICKCLKLANIHDLAEIYVGDYTPIDNITPQEKHQKEQDAMQRLAKELNSLELVELFAEFEAQKTPEAIFVKNMDKLDAVIQAKFYDDTQGFNGELFSEFYNYAATQISHPLVKKLLLELKS